MVKVVFALVACAQAGDVSVTYSDCGDSSTHGHITDIQPTTISTGTTANVVGTGTLDEAVNGGTFSAVVMAAGVKVVSCSGDASQDIECKLPLGVGSISVKALPFPLAAGELSVTAQVKTSSLIPSSLAVTTSHLTATSDTGEDLVCVDLNTNAAVDAIEPSVQGGAIAVSFSDCGDSSTHGHITDLQPTSISTGTTSSVVGTGTLDQTINGGTFSAVVTAAGVKVVKCSGDASQDISCKLPLGVGAITVNALAFPLAAGDLSVTAQVQLSSAIPTSLAVTTTHVTAATDTGDDLVCLDLNTKQGLDEVSV